MAILDDISVQRLSQVNLDLAIRIKRLSEICPIPFRVVQGLRSSQAQAALYAQGRTAPGEIVTHAPPGFSWHEYGLAVDIVPMIAGAPNWGLEDANHQILQRWLDIRAAAESVGLVSGSRWHSPDWPHLQLTGKFPVSPSPEARTLLAKDGISAVWAAAGLSGAWPDNYGILDV